MRRNTKWICCFVVIVLVIWYFCWQRMRGGGGIAIEGLVNQVKAATTSKPPAPTVPTPALRAAGGGGKKGAKKNAGTPIKEGFQSLINDGESSMFNMKPPDWKKWFGNNPSNPNSANYSSLHSSQQFPLPNGEMVFLADTKFSPSCCANNPAYSNSSGCACLNVDQYNYLRQRGGNNVPEAII